MGINILIPLLAPLLVTTAPRRGNSSIAQGNALGIRHLHTMRPVRATLNKTLFNYTNAVNPLNNSGYVLLVVYVKL